MNVYIDSENISPDSFFNVRTHYLSQEIPILSVRVYNDWTENTSLKWNRLCRHFSMDQVQCAKRKDSVDFSIIIDIMEHLHADDMNHRRIRKVLIVSGDTDYINVTNRVREKGRDVEAYSPHYENKLYRQQANVFYDHDQLRPSAFHTCIRDDVYHSHRHDNSNSNSESEYSECESEEGPNDAEHTEHYYKGRNNIIRCFLWHNPRKSPFKKIKLATFLKVGETLKRSRLIQTDVYNELDEHSDIVVVKKDKHAGEVCVEYIGPDVQPIATNVLTIVEDIKTAVVYDNQDDSGGVRVKTLLSKLSFLLDKNILKSEETHIRPIIQSSDSFNAFWGRNVEHITPFLRKKNNRVFLCVHNNQEHKVGGEKN